jgi:hypothetical protein
MERLRLLRTGGTRRAAAIRGAAPIVALLVLLALPSIIHAAPAWTITNVAALHAYPEFYQNRQVVIEAQLSQNGAGKLVLSAGGDQVQVITAETAPPDGLVEARGEFWNVGSMHHDDPRLRPAVQQALGLSETTPWPRSGTLLAIRTSSLFPASAPTTPTIRTIVLAPERFLGQTVTITGQFSGRNLLGELPNAPGLSQWDFVLRGDGAALWVTGVQPKGEGFSLDPGARMDTEHWLEITGIVRQGRGLVWIEPAKDGIKEGKPPTTDTATARPAEPAAPIAAFPPPEVIFSAPTNGEHGVSPTTTLRLQFSRDLDPATIKDNVRIGYLAAPAQSDASSVPTIGFTTNYVPDRRELDIHFDKPLEGFHTVSVELTSGILGADHQPLKPWSVSFTTGE